MIKLIAPVTAVALLAGCNSTKVLNDLQTGVQIGLGVAKAVTCATAGQGGLAAQRLEVALKKGDAWIETTGEIRAASAEACAALSAQ